MTQETARPARLTFTAVRAELKALGLTLRKTGEGEELRVAFPRNESAAYYTSDLEDAQATGRAMAAHAAADPRALPAPDAEGVAVDMGLHAPGAVFCLGDVMAEAADAGEAEELAAELEGVADPEELAAALTLADFTGLRVAPVTAQDVADMESAQAFAAELAQEDESDLAAIRAALAPMPKAERVARAFGPVEELAERLDAKAEELTPSPVFRSVRGKGLAALGTIAALCGALAAAVVGAGELRAERDAFAGRPELDSTLAELIPAQAGNPAVPLVSSWASDESFALILRAIPGDPETGPVHVFELDSGLTREDCEAARALFAPYTLGTDSLGVACELEGGPVDLTPWAEAGDAPTL